MLLDRNVVHTYCFKYLAVLKNHFLIPLQCLFGPSRSDSHVRMPRLADRFGGTFLVFCLGIEKNAKADQLKNRETVGTGFVELRADLGHCTEITVGRKKSWFIFAFIYSYEFPH